MELSKLLFGRGGAGASARRGCLQCGRCCEAFGGHLQASRGDLERWRRLGREDLLARVSPSGFLWMRPGTTQAEEECPFLRSVGPDRATCEIHDVKPDVCRDFPTLAHGRRCLRGGFLSWIGILATELPALLSLGLA